MLAENLPPGLPLWLCLHWEGPLDNPDPVPGQSLLPTVSPIPQNPAGTNICPSNFTTLYFPFTAPPFFLLWILHWDKLGIEGTWDGSPGDGVHSMVYTSCPPQCHSGTITWGAHLFLSNTHNAGQTRPEAGLFNCLILPYCAPLQTAAGLPDSVPTLLYT